MPERLRTFVNGLRRFVGERRISPRHRARLRAHVSLHAHHTTHHAPHTLAGHTRDISATGLALILPAIRLGERYLMGEGRKIDVVLELPTKTITLRATPVRYERVEEGEGDAGYIVGAHISEISEADRAHFIEYLRSLRKS